jgi:hypothetical protein
MTSLPPASTPPKEFFEQWLPAAFAKAPVPEAAKAVEVKLGIRLDGSGGGEWIFHMDHGSLRVAPGSAEPCPFTLIQTVEDWRGCLWEGRGGAFGKQAAAMFTPGAQPEAGAAPGAGRPMNPQAIERLGALSGVIRMVVSGGAGGDWRVDFKLGAGPVPADPTTTVTIAHEDADAMGRGELDPMQAFM